MRVINITGVLGLYGTTDYSSYEDDPDLLQRESIAGVMELAKDVIKFIKDHPDQSITITVNYDIDRSADRY